MPLYQINQSCYPDAIEQDWQASLTSGDSLILIEAGVLRTIGSTAPLEALTARGVTLLIREADVKAYGISPKIGQCITDQEWLNETVSHEKIISW
ncbi:DsrH/TusB family sulfur metabolism protein [Rhodanobacter aciditrophus]|uniref:DsrH/TusB family sulfur metabolism protein n=1 Tax=Rhodanobacter aciditrophus TaxID=1623218 RepID=A0ABW4B393_9GAMM